MSFVKVNLNGSLPEGMHALCIYTSHNDIVKGGKGIAHGDRLLYCNQPIQAVDDPADANTIADCWKTVTSLREVEVELSGIEVNNGLTAYALVVQPHSENAKVLVAVYDKSKTTYWLNLSKEVKIELLNC